MVGETIYLVSPLYGSYANKKGAGIRIKREGWGETCMCTRIFIPAAKVFTRILLVSQFVDGRKYFLTSRISLPPKKRESGPNFFFRTLPRLDAMAVPQVAGAMEEKEEDRHISWMEQQL